jgi:hypothetical protein
MDFKPLALHCFGFEPCQGLWIISCEEAIYQAKGILLVLFRCPLVPEIMHRRAPEVFLHQVKLESSHMIFTALLRNIYI